jgi:hypothetical protein
MAEGTEPWRGWLRDGGRPVREAVARQAACGVPTTPHASSKPHDGRSEVIE